MDDPACGCSDDVRCVRCVRDRCCIGGERRLVVDQGWHKCSTRFRWPVDPWREFHPIRSSNLTKHGLKQCTQYVGSAALTGDRDGASRLGYVDWSPSLSCVLRDGKNLQWSCQACDFSDWGNWSTCSAFMLGHEARQRERFESASGLLRNHANPLYPSC